MGNSPYFIQTFEHSNIQTFLTSFLPLPLFLPLLRRLLPSLLTHITPPLRRAGNGQKVNVRMLECWHVGMLKCLDWKQLGQLEKTTFKRCASNTLAFFERFTIRSQRIEKNVKFSGYDIVVLFEYISSGILRWIFDIIFPSCEARVAAWGDSSENVMESLWFIILDFLMPPSV